MVRIKLFNKELQWCKTHAEKIVNHYGGEGSAGSGSYNHNKISSNLVGVKSEVATKVWFKQFLPLDLIECNYESFEDSNLVGDLNIVFHIDIGGDYDFHFRIEAKFHLFDTLHNVSKV